MPDNHITALEELRDELHRELADGRCGCGHLHSVHGGPGDSCGNCICMRFKVDSNATTVAKSRADALDTALSLLTERGKMVAIPEGWKPSPCEPTEAMWSGLARQIIMWQRFGAGGTATGAELHHHLRMLAMEIPDWLATEIPDTEHVPSKGNVAAAIFKAMLAAAPQPPKGEGDE